MCLLKEKKLKSLQISSLGSLDNKKLYLGVGKAETLLSMEGNGLAMPITQTLQVSSARKGQGKTPSRSLGVLGAEKHCKFRSTSLGVSLLDTSQTLKAISTELL